MWLLLTNFIFEITVVFSINWKNPEEAMCELQPTIYIRYPLGFNITLKSKYI